MNTVMIIKEFPAPLISKVHRQMCKRKAERWADAYISSGGDYGFHTDTLTLSEFASCMARKIVTDTGEWVLGNDAAGIWMIANYSLVYSEAYETVLGEHYSIASLPVWFNIELKEYQDMHTKTINSN